MRRDANDQKWQEVKEVVAKRDLNFCRLCKCLTLKEALILRKNAGPFLNTLDPAHYIAVSKDASLMYDPNNICMLNRYSHSNLDSFHDPIDGHCITKEQVELWWRRILKTNPKQYKYLLDNKIIEEN